MPERTFWRPIGHEGRRLLAPSDSRTAEILDGLTLGATYGGELRRPRNPRFHRLMHAIGGLAADNLDAFEGMGSHAVLKRLQLEAGVACDELTIRAAGQTIPYRVPRSLSFASMGQDEFKRVSSALCDWLVRHYWPDTTVEEVEKMADEWLNRGAAW